MMTSVTEYVGTVSVNRTYAIDISGQPRRAGTIDSSDCRMPTLRGFGYPETSGAPFASSRRSDG